MRRHHRRTPPRRGRSGFTLIELLVVITLIAILIALSAAATLKYISSQQLANTRSQLDRTQSQLNKQWSNVKDQAQQETIPDAKMQLILNNIPTGLGLAGNDQNAVNRARVIWVKLRLRQAFPMNFDEALNNATANTGNLQSPLPALPAYTTYLKNLGITGSTGSPPPAWESSACLLMALARGVSGGGIDQSQLTSFGSTANVNGVPVLVDAWGQPIIFSRNPSGSLALNPAGATATKANDPLDPQGYLNSGNWAYTPPPPPKQDTSCRNRFSSLTLQTLANGTGMSFKLSPMLCSAGPNKTLESNPITFAPGGDDLFSTP